MRRIRELRVEHGWEITAGPDADLQHGEYRLEAAVANIEQAEQWRVRNEIRRMEGSAANRCLEYLKRIYPNVASKEELQYVARISDWPRRMRELEEAGWEIVSSVDDPTLKPGSYRLALLSQGPPRERQAIKRRREIFKRDNWTCQECGASPRTTQNTVLQVHHRHQVSLGGDNDERNLVTLCTSCHQGVHANEVSDTEDELLYPAKDPWRFR